MRNSNAYAASEVALLVLSYLDLERLFICNPRFGRSMCMRMMSALVSRLDAAACSAIQSECLDDTWSMK